MGVEITEYDVGYEPPGGIKAQALVHFIQEMAMGELPEQIWLLYVNGSSASRGAGAGIVLVSPEGDQLDYADKFGFRASNNEAEYDKRNAVGSRIRGSMHNSLYRPTARSRTDGGKIQGQGGAHEEIC